MDYDILCDAGITQGELATIVGVTRVTVNFWVNGRSQPNRYVAKRLNRVMAAIKAAVDSKSLPLLDKHDRIPQLKKIIARHLTD